MKKRSVNPWLTVVQNQSAEDPVEMLIYGQIGKDYYGEDGLAAKDFDAALKAIPQDKKILIRINSPGGNVWDGLAIYNMIRGSKDRVTCQVDGIAASISSIIALGGSRLQMPKSAMMMMHNPSAYAYGDADDLRQQAEKLDRHKDVLAGIYAEHCDMSAEEISDAMDKETWLTGAECLDKGMCDEVTEDEPVFNNFDLSCYRHVPAAVVNKKTAPSNAGAPPNIMNRQEMIALLQGWGVPVANDATDQWLKDTVKKGVPQAAAKPDASAAATAAAAAAAAAQPAAAEAQQPAVLIDIQNELRSLREQRDLERRANISQQIDNCIAEDRIPLAQRQACIDEAVKNEKVLAIFKAMPQRPPGGPAVPVEIVSDSIEDIDRGILNFRAPIVSMMRGNRVEPVAIRNGALAVAQAVEKHRGKLIPVYNANNISADLKRALILSESMRAFKRRIVPLNIFAHTYQNVPLEGTDTVIVPYYPLATTASIEFSQTDGYVFTYGTQTLSKKITVGGVADGVTNGRLYQPLTFSAWEFARQPWLDVAKLAMMAAEQLSIDLFNNVCSPILKANFGNAVKSTPAAGFFADDVADIEVACNQADWPEVARNLVLDSAYYGNLLKDPYVKAFLNIGDTGPIRQAKIGGLYGFEETIQCPRIPTNGENLVGFAAFPSAILVATAPIMPAPGERRLMLSYDVMIDPDTGASFQYKYWGEPQKSADREVIEVCFGKDLGELAALKRIVSVGT